MERMSALLGGGEIEYVDTGDPGGHGGTVVLLHGALMDEHLWTPVVGRLPSELRCVVPILPLGAHRIARPDGADQSPRWVARLVADLIRELGLHDVTIT